MAKKPKQTDIPGTELKLIAEVDTAAEHYVEQRDKRMRLTVKEVEAKAKLMEVMVKNGLTIYKDANTNPPLVVTYLPGKANVKVASTDDDGGTVDVDDDPAGGDE